MFFLVYMHAVLFLLNFYFTATGRVGKEHDTATVTEDEEATQQNSLIYITSLNLSLLICKIE